MNNTSSTDTFDFTDDEIKSELSRLGYTDIGKTQFEEFKKDLMTLVQVERSRSFGSQDSSNFSSHKYEDKYAHLYDDPEENQFEKENYGAHQNVRSHSFGRAPLKTKSNTVHLSNLSVHKKPEYYYRETDDDIPLASSPEHAVSDYYQPLSRYYQHPNDRTMTDGESHCADDVVLSNQLDDKLNISKTSTSSQGSLIKRKVVQRFSDGTSNVYEHSYFQDESDSEYVDSDENTITRADERLPVRALATKTNAARSITVLPSKPVSARYDKSVDPVLSAVIWPETKSIPARHAVKTDPVSRFHQYQYEWKKTKVPEERKHKGLRWAIREQMLYKEIVYEKPQKNYVENKYVVPTDKKRKDLRWRIRADMAAGFLPGSQ